MDKHQQVFRLGGHVMGGKFLLGVGVDEIIILPKREETHTEARIVKNSQDDVCPAFLAAASVPSLASLLS